MRSARSSRRGAIQIPLVDRRARTSGSGRTRRIPRVTCTPHILLAFRHRADCLVTFCNASTSQLVVRPGSEPPWSPAVPGLCKADVASWCRGIFLGGPVGFNISEMTKLSIRNQFYISMVSLFRGSRNRIPVEDVLMKACVSTQNYSGELSAYQSFLTLERVDNVLKTLGHGSIA